MPRQTGTHIDDPASVGARLRHARKTAGLRLADIAFEGCSIAHLSHIENGNRTPSLQVIRELARRIGVTEQWLALGLEGDESALTALDEAEAALRFDDTETASHLFTQALEAVTRRERARAHSGLGQLAFRRDEPRGAIEQLERAIEIDAAVREDASAMDTLGRAYAQIGEAETAVALFQERLNAYEAVGDPIGRTRFGMLLANALVDLSSFDEAATLLCQLLSDEQDSDPLTVARLQWAQSRLYAAKGEHGPAGRFARKALDVLEATEFTQYRSRAHHLLAYIEIGAGHHEEALELIESGRRLALVSGTPFDTARFDLEEARARAHLGQHDDAVSLLERAAVELIEHDPTDLGRCYAELAQIAATDGEVARAHALYLTAVSHLERHPTPALADTLHRFGTFLEENGDRDAAFDAFKRSLAVSTSIGAPAVSHA